MYSWCGRDPRRRFRQHPQLPLLATLRQIFHRLHGEGHERGIEWKAVPLVIQIRSEHEEASSLDRLLDERRRTTRKSREHCSTALIVQTPVLLNVDVSKRAAWIREGTEDGMARVHRYKRDGPAWLVRRPRKIEIDADRVVQCVVIDARAEREQQA